MQEGFVVNYVKAQRLRRELTQTLIRILEKYHAVISPTTPTTTVKITEA